MSGKDQAGAGRRWSGMVVPAAVLALVLGSVAANAGLRALLADAVARLDLRAVWAVLPVQFAAIMLCAAAQQALKLGVPYRASLAGRLVRDAAHNLLIFPPGLGEVVGARALVLLGARARASVALRALDLAAEVIAELPYMGLAFFVLSGLAGRGMLPAVGVPRGVSQWGWLGVPGLVLALWLGWRWLTGPGRRTRIARRARVEAWLLAHELRRQRVGLPLAVVLHFIAWGLSGVQVWIAARIFGLNLSLFGALGIESAATSARLILFFVPGGLVMQEAGAVLAGAALGVAAAPALALSLVLRLRDVCFGVALLAWPWLEWRARSGRRG